jgi:hypothetical protein
MSRRLLIALTIGSSIIVSMIIASYFLQSDAQTIYILVSVLFLLYVALYLFGGLAKLIVFFIYGVLIAITLALFDTRFSLAIIFIGTLLFVLNPLADFENYLNKTLDDEDIEPFKVPWYGKFETFYAYRKEMKSHYHLPQVRKLYTKKWYQKARTITVFGLFAIDIFMLIFVANDIAIFRSITPNNALVIYFITIVFIMMILLHKKGFTTMMRVVRLSVFLPIIFILAVTDDISTTYKWIFLPVVIIFGVTMGIVELIRYYMRVSYNAYQYYDQNRQELVFANALFEPLVYNEHTTEIGHYGMEVSLETFQAHLNEILIYANLHRFILTAYTHNKKYAYIYAEFHKSQHKRILKFQTFLEGIFKTHVGLRQFSDLNRKFYENTFFHNADYIVARALNLAHLLNELEIRGEVIISLMVYFKEKAQAKSYIKAYPSRELDYDEDGVITLQTNVRVRNLDYIIENTVRDILLELKMNQGTYVRIMLYY